MLQCIGHCHCCGAKHNKNKGKKFSDQAAFLKGYDEHIVRLVVIARRKTMVKSTAFLKYTAPLHNIIITGRDRMWKKSANVRERESDIIHNDPAQLWMVR